MTILDLAQFVIERVGGGSVEMVPRGLEHWDGEHRYPHMEKASRLVGYLPKRDMAMIVDDVAAWLRTAQ